MYKAVFTYEVDLVVVAGDFLWCFGTDTHKTVRRFETQINFAFF